MFFRNTVDFDLFAWCAMVSAFLTFYQSAADYVYLRERVEYFPGGGCNEKNNGELAPMISLYHHFICDGLGGALGIYPGLTSRER